MLVCAMVSGTASLMLKGLPSNLGLLAAALAGIALGLIAESLKRPPGGARTSAGAAPAGPEARE
jgi:hypothetical protein